MGSPAGRSVKPGALAVPFNADYPASPQRLPVRPSRKVFCDPVHGQISLHPVSVAVVDTPEFQRLRHVRQLGAVCFVYPGASHSRFEHSLGTAHLARLLGARLRENQPELNITEKELLCLELAGLCHDLGHGPFSHLWEDFYRRGARDRGLKPVWTHEAMSCKLLQHLVSVNGLQEIFDMWEVDFGQGLTARDLKLVQALIMGDCNQDDPARRFLFQIVNNADSSLDVDKWDYYLRDCHAVGLTSAFQYERLVGSARVISCNGATHIAFRDKELANVYEMFRTRSRLHQSVYRHHVVALVEAMICDALLLADEKALSFAGGVNCRLRLWETTHKTALPGATPADMEQFVAMTESFVELSVRRADASSSHPDVVRAQRLWNALYCRFRKSSYLYQFLGSVPHRENLSAESVIQSLLTALPEAARPQPQDLVVRLENVHWGRAEENPVKRVLFYRKALPDIPVRADDLRPRGNAPTLPLQFQDSRWYILLRGQAKPGLETYLEEYLDTLH
ncbi:hypothetical protein HPB48_007564 [Haemaphysalis longicornis]|uniref:HD domain-containing protein n=1 Tax=Haemaphysalis longicornis TaxID=44386 RepID=A0A9J6FCV1_HAELO|nr:hypothetical protein HPB48_007564 [Haemaphysalis longicornis]